MQVFHSLCKVQPRLVFHGIFSFSRVRICTFLAVFVPFVLCDSRKIGNFNEVFHFKFHSRVKNFTFDRFAISWDTIITLFMKFLHGIQGRIASKRQTEALNCLSHIFVFFSRRFSRRHYKQIGESPVQSSDCQFKVAIASSKLKQT